MRKILISLLIVCFSCSMQAQNISNTTTMNIQEIADRMALKSLVDTFSNLADTKEIDEQVQLFTADAEVISYQGEKQTSHLKGRKELAERFKAFLDQFTTVYHINGQQTVNIDGDKATGIAYAQVVLVSEKDGKKTMRTQGVRYNDEYELECATIGLDAREATHLNKHGCYLGKLVGARLKLAAALPHVTIDKTELNLFLHYIP